ncbi:hypothetical protein CDD80_3827 [Ophiocordyceps camponoti-rufipedis]|uniref:Phosphoinositide phospholipase C n=1 Tax=Ophiocordyceps camponoti-rufipedis TaxID=2004952 RepID=A0A2C5YV58_9HYPO|nr:hypothetical protein CDD80_3827 [Ophiocordyceps camponoti-rufipedis]
MADLSSRLGRLKPFSRGPDDEDDYDDIDDGGEVTGQDAIGGGGRYRRNADHEVESLKVSDALQSLLVDRGVLPEAQGDDRSEVLAKLLDQNDCCVPDRLMDGSRPLPEYFVSSSHNTYLLAHQLYGTSSAEAYKTTLRMGARCVEIDAWDNAADPDEPKVTHGYTFVSHVPFRAVCEAIRDIHDEEKEEIESDPTFPVAPILLSLENHCKEHGQRRLVAIMKEVFGSRLLCEAIVKDAPPDEYASPADVGLLIAVMVEFHFDDAPVDDCSTCSEDDSTTEATPAEAQVMIVPELAELGVYAQSVKPLDNSWYDPGELVNGPHHHLINISETGLSKHLPANGAAIAAHNARYLMRVFPKGTRISSSNLKPVAYWGIGAQVCALNWQTFGTGNLLNDALFNGSNGYVLKPTALRPGGSGILGSGRRRKLRLYVAGATDVPLPEGREADSIKPYLTCVLYSPCDIEGATHKRKTSAYRQHRLGFLHRGENPRPTDPIWDETLQWKYEDNELVFLRLLVKSDDPWARNPAFAAAAIRLDYAEADWCFVRMMDMKGRETDCTVLVRFGFEDL